jgi:hypothetical protein
VDCKNINSPVRPQPPGTVADCDQQAETDIRCGQDDSQQTDIRGKVKYRHHWLIAALKSRVMVSISKRPKREFGQTVVKGDEWLYAMASG